MLKEDTKNFYRNLGTKNIDEREPICVPELELYWNSLWGEEAKLNERTEMVIREEIRKMCNMDIETIQIMNIT
jgi:hypothetical protein